MLRYTLVALFAFIAPSALQAGEPKSKTIPAGHIVEEMPPNATMTKIVVIVGSTYYKPGEHDYMAAGGVLADLLRQTNGVFPVIAVDWPKKASTFKNAKAVVFLFDGAAKHEALKADRFKQLNALMDSGVGLTQFHQTIDYPTEYLQRARDISGGVFEKGYSQRAHWISEFSDFPKHPIFNGVTAFKIDDGWLYKLRYEPKGVTPLLRTTNPKAKSKDADPLAPVVAWAFDRPGGGRTFNFSGCHLHDSFAQAGYRRFLTNGILWSAGLPIPEAGAPVQLPRNVADYLQPAKAKK